MQVRIGTRSSKLALWQANQVKQRLEADGIAAELVHVKTLGDRVQDVPLGQLGAQGIFTKALDDALLEARVDIAVHSAKDMPAALPGGLALLATLKRADPRDVFVSTKPEISLEDATRNLRVGTSSVRRRALVRHYFPGAELLDIRGNLDTRLRRLSEGKYDVLVLAAAGLARLGVQGYFIKKINPHTFTPAVGQGAVAVVGRAQDSRIPVWASALDHPTTHLAVRCERAFLRKLQGGCQSPIFGLATVTGDILTLTAGRADTEGVRIERLTRSGPLSDPELLGEQLADELLDDVAIST